MDNGSSFIDFASYLGLNDEAGQQMLDKSMGIGDGMRQQAESEQDNQNRSAGQLNQSLYDAQGANAKQHLASYGEFMQGMADPAARRTLMEKTYGMGSVSWLDSAMAGAAGGGSGMAAKQSQYQQAMTDSGLRSKNNDRRYGMFQERAAETERNRLYDIERAEKNKVALEAQRKRQEEQAEDARIDAWGRALSDRDKQKGYFGRLVGKNSMGWDYNPNKKKVVETNLWNGLMGTGPNQKVVTGREDAKHWLDRYESGGKKWKPGDPVPTS